MKLTSQVSDVYLSYSRYRGTYVKNVPMSNDSMMYQRTVTTTITYGLFTVIYIFQH